MPAVSLVRRDGYGRTDLGRAGLSQNRDQLLNHDVARSVVRHVGRARQGVDVGRAHHRRGTLTEAWARPEDFSAQGRRHRGIGGDFRGQQRRTSRTRRRPVPTRGIVGRIMATAGCRTWATCSSTIITDWSPMRWQPRRRDVPSATRRGWVPQAAGTRGEGAPLRRIRLSDALHSRPFFTSRREQSWRWWTWRNASSGAWQ